MSEAADDLRAMAPGSAQPDELLTTAETLSVNAASMDPATWDLRARKQMHYQSWSTSQRRKKREP